MAAIIYRVLASADDGYVYPPSGIDASTYYPFFGYYYISDYKLDLYTRFSNINIPKGAKITQAYIKVGAYGYTLGTINSRIYGCAEDNSSAVTSYSNYYAKSLTTSYTDWAVTLTSTSSWIDYTSGSIVDVIQEIVDRSGWTAGNHIQLLIKVQSTTSNAQCQVECYEVSSSYTDAMYLYIEWSVPTSTSTAEMIAPSIVTSISQNVNAVNVNTAANMHSPSLVFGSNISSVNINTNVSMQVPAVNYGYSINSANINIDATMHNPTIYSGILINAVNINTNTTMQIPSINYGYSIDFVNINTNATMHNPTISIGVDRESVNINTNTDMQIPDINYGYSIDSVNINISAEMKVAAINYDYIFDVIYMSSTAEMNIHEISYGWSIDAVNINVVCSMGNHNFGNGASITSVVMTSQCDAKVPNIQGAIGYTVVLMAASCNMIGPTLTYDYSNYVTLITITCDMKSPSISAADLQLISVPAMTVYGGMCLSNSIEIELAWVRCRMIIPHDVAARYLSDGIVSEIPSYFYLSRYEEYKFELLTLDNNKYRSSGFITEFVKNATISIDFTRDVIGTASFTVDDNVSDQINYMTDLIRPYYIINNTYEYALGTYMLTTPAKISNGKFVSRNISSYDLLLALDQDKTIESYSISAGTVITDEIKSILDSVGGWVNYNIVNNSQTLPDDIAYELGRSKLFIINSLLNMINYYPLCCNGFGVYMGIPWAEDKNVIWTFVDDNNSIYASGINQDIDYSTMYNRVVIINNQLNEDVAPLYKVWTLEDEGLSSHPFSYTSIGRYVTKKFDSEAVSQDYIDLRARREIRKLTEVEESISYNHMFAINRNLDGLPRQGDSYEFKNTLLNVNEIYLIQSQDYNLKVGNMVKSTIKRVRSI